jgi:superfamily II DNA/RNA helicase
MNIFDVHKDIVDEYNSYISSFINIEDERIKNVVSESLDDKAMCPPPLIQFNPNFEKGAVFQALTNELQLHPSMNEIFKGYHLYYHQEHALRLGCEEKDFVVTSGTGSGKSVTYLANIFNYVLKNKDKKGIKAIIVYPMNALINSQEEELNKFRDIFEKANGSFPITYAKYTGQEKEGERTNVKQNPPDIILTNYMMLELIMTRIGEIDIRESMNEGLKYLVFDELHTYKGRQGADVSFLIRRIRANVKNDLYYIGTSATMSSGKGSIEEQKVEVANVASRIFGKNFTSKQIISERLEPSTIFDENAVSQKRLEEVLLGSIDTQLPEEILSSWPTAIWLEHFIGLNFEDGIYKRNKIVTMDEITEKLASASGVDKEKCKIHLLSLLEWAEVINKNFIDNNIRKGYFPFRLHQFISQTGSVYVSLDTPEKREITLKPGYYVKSKVSDSTYKIYPVVFSRITGADFICVKKNVDEKLLNPRGFTDMVDEIEDEDENFNVGYIFFDRKENVLDEYMENLPESWYKIDKNGNRKINKDYANRVPQKIYFNTAGKYSDKIFDNALEAIYMPCKLLFDPSCMAFYDNKTSEKTKLASIGNEGRSTATTTLSLASIRALGKSGVGVKEQKLLSFTDNRQDASLQAGHFNDLVNISLIRSALYQAMKNHPEKKLDVDMLGDEVFIALNLDQAIYALQPSDQRMGKEENEKALKNYLTLRLMQDLKRGWRYTLPNLEQCGLLKIEYKYLQEECENEDLWQNVPYLCNESARFRFSIVTNTLDYIRTSRAINHRFFYDGKNYLEENIKERIKEEWGLSEEEHISSSVVARYYSLGKIRNEPTFSIGKASQWGKYIKSKITIDSNTATLDEFADALFEKLSSMQYLKSVELKGEKISGIGYLVNATAMLWSLDSGEHLKHDEVRIRTNKEIKISPNEYFKNIYKSSSDRLKTITGAEHTGQISSDTRKVREDDFRNGKLSTLFCSPTMELGIDIKELSIVHMRNVPPSPANYAQRSGRAGRSGQGAIVLTYCSQFSPHDRNYFNKKESMVAGIVVPPRIDISNNELIKSHVNAIYMMETGLDFTKSISEIIDEETPLLKLREDIQSKMKDGHELRKKVVFETVKRILSFSPESRKEESVIGNWIDSVPNEFDQAFERWRKLHIQAKNMIAEARLIKDNPVYTTTSPEKIKARSDEKFGENLLIQLRNESGRSESQNALSEYYPYRYLASEGFLPGYNFTKLPTRVMLRNKDKAEFISRPRMIGLSEFGPKNIIYHNGKTYEIKRIIKESIEANLLTAKISKDTGYFLVGENYNRETCPMTGSVLSGQKDYIINHLLEIGESEAREKTKINCEEEERMRMGYEISTYFYEPSGVESRDELKIIANEDHLLDFTFMPACKIVNVNKKWNRTSRDGFLIDKVYGEWRKEADLTKPQFNEKIISVKTYADYTADALYIKPMVALGLSQYGIITLQHALKRAIEEVFQIESNEIAVTTIGNTELSNILIYESTEGSLGVMQQLAKNVDYFHKVIAKAYELCHFINGEDSRPELGPASYDDLLSYYNQRDHEIIDRHLIKEGLQLLLNCTVERKPKNFVNHEEQYQYLLKNLDKSSPLEKRFIDYLFQSGLRLPDIAQPSLKEELGLYIQPDFQYDDSIYVFCDGEVHMDPAIAENDKKQRNAMVRRGKYRIITVKFTDTFDAVIKENNDIFTKVK